MSKFKGTMANYYQEARSQVKAIKERQMANKKKNERRQELEDAQKESPLHYLRLDARPCKLFKNDAQYYAIQNNEGLVPWNGQQDTLIDRYDARSLLDMYVEPDLRVLRSRPKTAKQQDLEEMLAFEGFRDLIRLSCLGLTEAQGIAHAQEENVVLRAQAKAQAQAAALANLGKSGGSGGGSGVPGQIGPPAGSGAFAAVGFSYGGEEEGSGDDSGSDEEEDSEEEEEGAGTAEDVDMDRLAELFGVEDFSSMLRWAMRQEAEEAEANRNKPKRKWSRKKAALRAKRMAGKALPRQFAAGALPDAARPLGGTDLSWIPERSALEGEHHRGGERGSPRYDDEPWHRERERDLYRGRERGRWRSRSRSPSRSRSRSLSPGAAEVRRRRGGGSGRPQMEFITEFNLGGGGPGASAGASRRGGGAAAAPAAGEGPPSFREAVPGEADPSLEGPALLPEQALRVQGVKPQEARALARAREREKEGGGGAGRGRSLAAISAAEASRPVDKARETPQERIKRLMAAQLNKKIQKDSVQEAQKKLQEEREREARQATERLAYSSTRSSDRDRDRDRQYRGTDRYRDRSRSRSRSRSPPRYRSSYRDSDRYRRSPSPYGRRR